MKLKTRVLGAVGAVVLAGSMVAMAVPASAAPTAVGSCTGSKSLAKLVGNGVTQPPTVGDNQPLNGIGDQTGPATAKSALLKTVDPSHTLLHGSCSGAVITALTGLGSLTPKAQASKFAGSTGCASGATAEAADATAATAYPLNGKLTTTMVETDPLGHPYKIDQYLSFLGQTGALGDGVDLAGIVVKGVIVGANISGSFYQEPVYKQRKYFVITDGALGNMPNPTPPPATLGVLAHPGNPAFVAGDVGSTVTGTGISAGTIIVGLIDPHTAVLSQSVTPSAGPLSITIGAGLFNSGYFLDVGPSVTNCQDGTPNNSNISQVLIGDGLSPLGTSTTGLNYTFGE